MFSMKVETDGGTSRGRRPPEPLCTNNREVVVVGGGGSVGGPRRSVASGRLGSGVPVNSNMISQWCVSTLCFVHPKKRNEGEERGAGGGRGGL